MAARPLVLRCCDVGLLPSSVRPLSVPPFGAREVEDVADGPKPVERLVELIAEGFTLEDVVTGDDELSLRLSRAARKETITLDREATVGLISSKLFEPAAKREPSKPEPLLVLEGMLRDGFEVDEIDSSCDHVEVTLQDGEHTETLSLPPSSIRNLAWG